MPAPCVGSNGALSIRSRRDRSSLADGGCGFAYDPDRSAVHEPVFWLPEHSPGTLILAPARGRWKSRRPFDPAAIGPILAERADANGRELIVRDISGDVHIWLTDEAAAEHPMVVVPPDGAHRLRLDLASRFIRRLLGHPVGLLPPKLRLTDLQRRHYIQLLHTADLYEEGGEPRDVASRVLHSEQAALPAIEFKDTAARKRADRLIKDAVAMVSREYLKLLRGG
ncbi:DUF2285 domain-containing protein [Acidomonas methanolica]|uniref:DUF2285 domain-containing protein n=1 Tax=Acidomonas methanolica TaxID=437 RepID=UPI00211A79A9|nr:DUF2285 domain-containing protein [Acidomonas methanolica]MCQ9155191.1 DUF2285 domain-containing protein [Acidomonas methanolica]